MRRTRRVRPGRAGPERSRGVPPLSRQRTLGAVPRSISSRSVSSALTTSGSSPSCELRPRGRESGVPVAMPGAHEFTTAKTWWCASRSTEAATKPSKPPASRSRRCRRRRWIRASSGLGRLWRPRRRTRGPRAVASTRRRRVPHALGVPAGRTECPRSGHSRLASYPLGVAAKPPPPRR